MKNGRFKREKSIQDGHMPSSDDQVNYTIKGYVKECFKICFNKVFMLSVFGITVKTLYAVGLAAFLAKILVLKFGVPQEKAGIWLGVILLPTMISKLKEYTYYLSKSCLQSLFLFLSMTRFDRLAKPTLGQKFSERCWNWYELNEKLIA